MHRVIPVVVLCLALWPGPPPEASELDALEAPVRLYPEPRSYLLLPLGGDRTHFRYTPGSLDRAANLQQRLEVLAHTFERWTDQPFAVKVFVLSRREWEEARIDVRYGIPVRVGARGIAAPSRGDPDTVQLWSELLGGRMPTVMGTPVLGTPQELASMVVADKLVQLQAGQILVDNLGLQGDEPWVGSVVAHLAALSVALRIGMDRPGELEGLYRQLLSRHPPKTFSLRDYGPGLSLRNWLYFQAQFHFAARTIFDKAGKDSLKKTLKLRNKGGGTLPADRLTHKYKQLDEYLKANFSVVSFRR